MFTLHIVLAALVITVGLVAVIGENILRRSLVDYRPVQILAVITAVALAPANLMAASGSMSPRIAQLTLIVTAAMIFAIPAIYVIFAIRTPKAAHSRRILAIGAHPDDLELAAGGTIARLADAGHEVHSLVMTCGSVGGDPSVRYQEATNASMFLGVDKCEVYDFTDTNLNGDMCDMISVIESKIRSFNPDIILTHSSHDQHQDHSAVHLATLRAGRRHPAILCFESPSTTMEFSPQVFVDIEQYVGVKSSAVALHRDQAGKPYMTGERVAGMANFRGDQSKLGKAEGFEAVRLDAFKVMI